MHELSIAVSVVEAAAQHADENGVEAVSAVTLRIGSLSCVHKQSLEFSFDLVKAHTKLSGAVLRYIDVPIAVRCDACDRVVEPPGSHNFRCPDCGAPSANVVRGDELDIESIEAAEPAACSPGGAHDLANAQT